ncbi:MULTISPECIES: Hvo_1808 family surface protein [unclassified Haladaptatus]|uniref:Hvo_1808 family surface protein n=1 Tax=unclassified Haladaptatus TaxID=2622732 RepID=UPI00209C409F|nr:MULTISPECIES: Hvo_1808 family surface protein [unclassified Haladaptatus]MCO8246889.1 Hvo_1808 family surface protein [Haladaptatus sp. AB643]MCO8253585.1 Hvo_1808 family surface protein [Haladaptatus sp. AB618]
MRTFTVVALALMLVLAGCAQAPGTNTSTSTSQSGPDVTSTSQSDGTAVSGPNTNKTTHPPDPKSDVLGWENGYWYNETLSVDASDGFNQSEVEAIVNRAMARDEKIRHLEFTQKVPVKIISRKEFRKQQSNQSVPANRQLFDNAKYESLFMINESTDSIAVQNTNSGSSVGGYYSPSKDSIVLVSNDNEHLKVSESTLSHELMHALQDQHFDITSFNKSTRERTNAINGLLEGEANNIEFLYQNRCQNQWKGTCLSDTEQSSGGDLANIGPYLIKYQPYSDGPAFIRYIRKQQGWKGVNQLYSNPPTSTEQIIHPEKYPSDEPSNISVQDTTSDGWKRLKPQGRPSYGQVGETGIFAMFMYPYYESQGTTQIIPAQNFFNKNGDNLQTVDPLNYESKPTDGWDGDKIVVYTNPNEPKNETGYVFKTKWDSKQDATQFVNAYKKLLNYHDAKKVDGKQNTWTVPDSTGFGDAFQVRQNGNTVTIVNAPTVSDLSHVHGNTAS